MNFTKNGLIVNQHVSISPS